MPFRNESKQASARLQLEAPISHDLRLTQLEEQVADIVREAKSRYSLVDQSVFMVQDAIARDYFRHTFKKKSSHRP